MPCHYPDGEPDDWCDRHKADDAMLRALREGGVSLMPPRRLAPV